MNISDIKEEGQKIIVDVSFNENEWKKTQENTLKELAKKVKVPGFRNGKAPISKIKSYVDQNELLGKSVDKIIKANFANILENSDLQKKDFIENYPEIVPIVVEENKLEVKFTFERLPKVELPDYKNIPDLIKNEIQVNDSDIDEYISKIVEKDILLSQKENGIIANGDFVVFDYKGTLDGVAFAGGEQNDAELVIGSKKFIPGFEEKMIGLKENEQKTIEVTFPSDYPQKDLAGKKANFELKIKKISTRKMPDLNDEYIASLQIPNVSNLTQLKDFVKKDITIKKENYNKQLNVEKIVNFLIKNAKIEFIPEKMISYESEKIFHQYQSQAKQYGISIEQFINFQGFSTIDDFNKMIDVTASENVSYSLVIDKISEEMKLTISDSESEEYYKAVAQQYRISVEELKKIITKNDEMLETIEISILRNKTLEELLKLNSKE